MLIIYKNLNITNIKSDIKEIDKYREIMALFPEDIGLTGYDLWKKYGDDEDYYDAWDKEYERTIGREIRDEEEFEKAIEQTILPKEFHIPDLNTPRLSEDKYKKPIIKENRKQITNRNIFRTKEAKKTIKEEMDIQDDGQEEWLFEYLENFEYYEYTEEYQQQEEKEKKQKQDNNV